LVVVALAVPLLLAGCTAAAPASTASTALRPGYPAALTAAVAKSETEHYAAAIAALLPAADVASSKTEEELVPATKTSTAYYAVIRTITVTAAANPLTSASAIKKQLVTAGWISHASANQSNQYLAAMASSKSQKTAWFLELGANDISGQPPTVTIQIGSPDLPNG
jgi:hypothetical protein